MRWLAVVLAWAIVSAPETHADAGGRQQPDAGAPGLESAYWRLTHLGGDEPTFQNSNREPHLVFYPGGSVTGADGCNTLRGGYTAEGDTLSFGALMGTLMACPGLPNRLDSRFREALGHTRQWRASATELTLLGDKDAVLARFQAVPR
ncbi:MAG: META domain-containing protein [Acidobacteria bacterium]|nr:META domain-containing protein [Acidobacteriota bacterium]